MAYLDHKSVEFKKIDLEGFPFQQSLFPLGQAYTHGGAQRWYVLTVLECAIVAHAINEACIVCSSVNHSQLCAIDMQNFNAPFQPTVLTFCIGVSKLPTMCARDVAWYVFNIIEISSWCRITSIY